MADEAGALADALDEPRFCLGCGHDERIPLVEGVIACCPDREYMTVEQMLGYISNQRRRISDLIETSRKQQAEIDRWRIREEPPGGGKPPKEDRWHWAGKPIKFG